MLELLRFDFGERARNMPRWRALIKQNKNRIKKGDEEMKMNFERDAHGFLKGVDMTLDFILNISVAYITCWVVNLLTPSIDQVRMFFLIVAFALLTSILYNYHNVYLPMRIQTPIFFISRIFFVHVEVLVVSVFFIGQPPSSK